MQKNSTIYSNVWL